MAVAPSQVEAQFLRVGPFDFFGKIRTGAVWSDNIEQERPAESTAERRDYFVYGGLDLKSDSAMSGGARLTLDSGFTIEKHFIRDDLDNSESPLGRFRAEATKNTGRLELKAFYSWERTSESSDLVIPGFSGKTRNPKETRNYGWGGKWKAGGGLSFQGEYDMLQDRFEKEAFRLDDKDTETIDYLAQWELSQKTRIEYEVMFEREADVRDPYDVAEWEATETIRVDRDLWRRPKVTFSLGLEREDQKDAKGQWEPIYEIKMADAWEATPRLKLTYSASYTYEDSYEEDDIAFVYDVAMEHMINSRTTQRVRLNREPRRTLGSTEDSDKTTYGYELRFDDVFIPNLSLSGMVDYDITVPPDTETELVWTYRFKVAQLRQLSSRLKREFKYIYEAEDSNLESEILIENRFEWNYVYDL